MTDEPATHGIPLERPFGRQLRSHAPVRGTVLSAALHAAVIALLLWAGRHHFFETSSTPGDEPGRGGGGGGIRGLAVFAAQAMGHRTAPQPPPAQPAPRLEVPQNVQPLPESPHTDSVPVAIVQPPNGAGDPAGGQGTTPGAGPGSGGGTGSGLGPGVGSDTGSGGGGGTIHPPDLIVMPIPPTNAPREVRGTSLAVTFRVSERGEVLDVSVDPPIRDRGYRNEFIDKMKTFRFRPAYTRDGRPVAAEIVIRIRVGG